MGLPGWSKKSDGFINSARFKMHYAITKRKRNIRKQRSREAAIGRYNDEAHGPSFQLDDGIDKQVVKSGYPPPPHPRASDTLKSNKIGEYGGHDPSPK
jgi:hypothetical protein